MHNLKLSVTTLGVMAALTVACSGGAAPSAPSTPTAAAPSATATRAATETPRAGSGATAGTSASVTPTTTASATPSGAATAAAGQTGASTPPAAATPRPVGALEIAIRSNDFPATTTVDGPVVITWRNASGEDHDVEFGVGANLGTMKQGGTVQRRFDTPGRFSYYCTFHDDMAGVIVVR